MLQAISRLKAYRKMSRAEKGLLLDTLCVLEGSGGGFYADLKYTVPLTTSQIAKLLGFDEITWEKYKRDLLQANILKEHNGSVYCPYMTQVSNDGISEEGMDIAITILAHWNSKKIIVHNETPAMLKNIIKYVRKHAYELKQVTEAIDNYAVILNGSEYFWTKKWNLSDFLSRGVAKFQSDANPFEAYADHRHTPRASGKSIMTPRRECSALPTEDDI